MSSFISHVVNDLLKKNLKIPDLVFVLPNKRAGLYLKTELAKAINKTFIVPRILSIEEFIEQVSGLKYVDNTELIFKFYEVYSQHTPKEQIEPLESVTSWANMLIQDFNNIDRYLIPPNQIFDYLKDIKLIESDHWSLNKDNSDSINNYLSFWTKLKLYYHEFEALLISQKRGYQGLVYKEAVKTIDEYISRNASNQHIFVGFNALNKAEEIIIQKMLEEKVALAYWDGDKEFVENKYHDAGLFLRSHRTKWKFYEANDFNFLGENYSKPRTFKIISTPKNIGQVKFVGELLEKLKHKNGNLDSTALVLGDESLLLPLLNSLPQNVGPINITMGVELTATPLASLFELLFGLHKKNSAKLYYKEVVAILSHPSLRPIFDEDEYNDVINLLNYINKNNLVYLSLEDLKAEATLISPIIDILFSCWKSVNVAVTKSIALIYRIKDSLKKRDSQDLLALEFLYRFNKLFNEIKILKDKYNSLNNIASLYSIYKQLLKIETLDFQGEPLQGLQIMGMLETRVLDFKHIIMLSVNEGILPAGKNENSFIPYDVKKANQMPTYKEMDAVYTYHFYRLLQRAETVHLIYNSEPDALNGGEKSRFISQLQFERIHELEFKSIAPKAPTIVNRPKNIIKSDRVMQRLKELAEKGFSPSSLTNYVRNPMDFYYDKVLGIKESDLVEETVAANTLGTIIHNTLEKLYTPFINLELKVENLEAMLNQIDSEVRTFFNDEYKKGDITKGKNLIIFEICKRYVFNFIKKEIEEVKAGDSIIVLELEKKLSAEFRIPGLDFPIKMKGTVDRIDTCNGITRIIDFKTGKVAQGEVEMVDWEDITTDYKKYSKSFQLLCYAYLWNDSEPISDIEAGIISLKNLSGNFLLKFGRKPSSHSRTKNQLINSETLDSFEFELFKLIKEICDKKIDFIEKEV
ncbi:PD-(D/E)XK nuclease superfamily protein [Flavobacteriaceae bacterium MAR_2010_188]|nr:PD-(D/E)XK nuclease superfamily protein [Flavobacteriaceae bacterium MAR_2010_188]